MSNATTGPGIRSLRLDRFNETPDEIDWKIRDSFIPKINEGLTPIQSELIPVLEWEAIRILRKEIDTDRATIPDAHTDPDGWRLWWYNEARYLSYHTGAVPDAFDHLSPAVRHAVNTITAASQLRTAMETGNVEKVAALSILLAMQVLQGGYSVEHESAKRKSDKAQQNSIEKINREYAQLEAATIQMAAAIWKASPEMRIGKVVEAIESRIRGAAKNRDIREPTAETIKRWIANAGEVGKLTIPEAARKGGRPKKK